MFAKMTEWPSLFSVVAINSCDSMQNKIQHKEKEKKWGIRKRILEESREFIGHLNTGESSI